ncbi:MAG: hypothetical protein Q9169_000160 [Polycauliona sp. 2 TL-2023]
MGPREKLHDDADATTNIQTIECNMINDKNKAEGTIDPEYEASGTIEIRTYLRLAVIDGSPTAKPGSPAFTARHASSSATGGDMANPQSSSSEQQQVKSSRATDSTASPDTASVQQPVSDRSSIAGDQDEGTPSHDNVKQDPNKPAEEKRKNVESQGNKPLGPEDHQ